MASTNIAAMAAASSVTANDSSLMGAGLTKDQRMPSPSIATSSAKPTRKMEKNAYLMRVIHGVATRRRKAESPTSG